MSNNGIDISNQDNYQKNNRMCASKNDLTDIVSSHNYQRNTHLPPSYGKFKLLGIFTIITKNATFLCTLYGPVLNYLEYVQLLLKVRVIINVL